MSTSHTVKQSGYFFFIKAPYSSLVGIYTLFLCGKYQKMRNYQGGFINAALIKTQLGILCSISVQEFCILDLN